MRALIVAALTVGVWVALAPQGTGQPKQRVGQSESAPYAYKSTESKKNHQAPQQYSIEPAHFQVQEQHAQALNCSECQKQEEINIERQIGNYTGWLVLVGAVQFLVYVCTLIHLRKASARQLRAYVLPDNAHFLDGTTMVPALPANTPVVLMVIKNSGQTPAYKIVSWAQLDVVVTKDEGTKLIIPRIADEFSGLIGAGGMFTKTVGLDRQLSASEIIDIANGVRAIYLHGRIQYRDAFNKGHFSAFRLRYTGQFPPPPGAPPTATFNFSEQGNDAN